MHGAPADNATPPREPQILLPALLKHQGYQTAISGELHFIPSSLAADPTHAAVRKDLAARLEAWQQDVPPVPIVDGVAPEPQPGTPAAGRRKRK